jgi:hypothetical protein
VAYERDHLDGRAYTWVQGETLLELIARKDQIINDHQKAIAKEKKLLPQNSLVEILESVLDDEDDEIPCLACHL